LKPQSIIPSLLLVSLLTACKQNAASGNASSTNEMGNLVARGSGKITLTQTIEYKEIGPDGSAIQSMYSDRLEFANGILKPFPNGGTRGGSSISVTNDGWIVLRLQNDIRMIPPSAIKFVEGTPP